MRWVDLERDAPRLAARARELVVEPGVCLVATIRRDGSPRLSPVEPLLLDGDLWLSMLWGSRKAADLLADDRILVHSIVTSREGRPGEVKVRGRAVPVDDLERRGRYREAVAVLGWQPVEPWFHLFVVEVADVTSVHYVGEGDQHVARWPAGVEFVRRATSPTSVGDPEPVTDLLPPGPFRARDDRGGTRAPRTAGRMSPPPMTPGPAPRPTGTDRPRPFPGGPHDAAPHRHP